MGTCSWTDPTMVRTWYPPAVRTAADRLRYYATQFDTVEVDSIVLRPADLRHRPSLGRADAARVRLPHQGVRHAHAPRGEARAVAAAIARRPTTSSSIARAASCTRRPNCARDAFAYFSDALEPLRAEGKLGLVLMQFPPYFVANEANREYIAFATGLLAPDRVAVEFRHASWVQPEEIETTLEPARFAGRRVRLRRRAPHAGPHRAAADHRRDDRHRLRALPRPQRRHLERPGGVGRQSASSTSTARRNSASGWSRCGSCQEQTATTYVMFNNCFADYAPRNAKQMMSLLDAGGRATVGPRSSLRTMSGRLVRKTERGGAPRGAPPGSNLHS